MKISTAKQPLFIAVSIAVISIFILSGIVYPYLINSLSFYLSSTFNLSTQIFSGFLASFCAIAVCFVFVAIMQRQTPENKPIKYLKPICISFVLLVAVYLAVFLLNWAVLTLIDTLIPYNPQNTFLTATFFYISTLVNILVFVLKIFLMMYVAKISFVISDFAEKSYLKPNKKSCVQTTIILVVAALIAVFVVLCTPSLGMEQHLPWLLAFSHWDNLQWLANLLARYYIIAVSLFLSYKCYTK